MTEHVRRGGGYLRVADPEWQDPLDGTYSMRGGKRWNPQGSFPVVYLSATVEVARANCDDWFVGQPYGPLDVEPERAPVLVETNVPDDEYADALTNAGCTALGLPTTYPFDSSGVEVPWSVCQPIGQRLWDAAERGIACRSAALPRGAAGEELAYFQGGDRLPTLRVRPLREWY
jgi:RES domain-containing protein